MSACLFCTPQWMEANAKIYREKKEMQEPLKTFSYNMAYRIKADSSWGLDEDSFFCTFFNKGELTKISLLTKDEALKNAHFLLSAAPQTWKKLLTKKSNFPLEFSKLKIKLEKGGKLQMLSIAPYSAHVVNLLTQTECKFPDEMSAQELEDYRSTMKKLKSQLD